ncbi:MAG: hypothetical protein ABI779_08745 [Acidobacteriota bacterium]
MNELWKLAVVIACIAVSMPLQGGRRRTVSSAPAPLSIEFVDVAPEGATLVSAGSDAWIDLRQVGQQNGVIGKFVRVRRTVGIRIVRTGELARGTAVLTARLDALDGRSLVSIDGQRLTTAAMTVTSRAVIGTVSTHTLEIEVPDSSTPGPLALLISWEANTL